MTEPHVTKTEADPKLDPTGLVDPRAIHPGPDEADEPGLRADATPEPEGGPADDESSSTVPGSPAVEAEAGTGVVDPRSGLPGPDLGP